VPVNVTLCGLLLSGLSAIVKLALRAPVAVGLKFTETVQLPKPARLVPQVVALRKSPGSTPLRLGAVTVSAVLRLLVKVTTLAALVVPLVTVPKARLDGATVPDVAPVPVSVELWGELLALAA
jgi:hypothetical protein